MSSNKKLNTCPDCQGNGHHKYFTDISQNKTATTLCETCDGQTVLSDARYVKFTEEDKIQAEARWLAVHKPRTRKTLHISTVIENIMEDLQRGND
tara:strand:- start:649 stop:933 length:285 start_codon:yes stop_codon:yes gene_type:complete